MGREEEENYDEDRLDAVLWYCLCIKQYGT